MTWETIEIAGKTCRIAAADSLHVAQVGPVHADEQVKAAVVPAGQLPGGFAGAVDAVLLELAAGRRINRIPDFLGAGGGGLNEEVLLQTGLSYQILQDEFGHRASADIAVAYEKHSRWFHIPS